MSLVACPSRQSAEAPVPEPPARPLASLVAQQVIVAPAHSLRETDALGWAAQIPRSREYLRALDDTLAAELRARGLGTSWVFPPALVRAAKANPSYAVDPYVLAADPLREPGFDASERLTGPIVSQLRTMVALQENARFVLLPVELRFERAKDDPAKGVAVLKTALVDGRLGEVRWMSDVRSEPSPTLSPVVLSSLANKLADLITVR